MQQYIYELREALKEAADNYVTLICNNENVYADEVISDPIVARWYALAKGPDDGK